MPPLVRACKSMRFGHLFLQLLEARPYLVFCRQAGAWQRDRQPQSEEITGLDPPDFSSKLVSMLCVRTSPLFFFMDAWIALISLV